MRLAVVGGDARQKYCAELLKGRGHLVSVYPLGEGEDGGLPLWQALREADAVLLPIPITRSGERIVGTELTPSQILPEMKRGAHLLGGNISAALTAAARRSGVFTHDYMELEAFVLRNAYLTAQAALGILLTELSSCLYKAPIALLGFGRIAKFLSRMLVSLGAEVTVFARREKDLAMASLIGMRAEPISHLSKSSSLRRARAIVNTVPARLLEESASLAAEVLLLELASGADNLPLPGGVHGARLITAQGLPGKFYPRSAGEIVADATEAFLFQFEKGEEPS